MTTRQQLALAIFEEKPGPSLPSEQAAQIRALIAELLLHLVDDEQDEEDADDCHE